MSEEMTEGNEKPKKTKARIEWSSDEAFATKRARNIFRREPVNVKKDASFRTWFRELARKNNIRYSPRRSDKLEEIVNGKEPKPYVPEPVKPKLVEAPATPSKKEPRTAAAPFKEQRKKR